MKAIHLSKALVLALSLSACVGGSKGTSAEDKEKVKAYILDAPPADAKKIDINYENKVRIVGYKVEPELAPPGTEVKVTYYWRCDDTPEDGWMLFTHVVDDASGQALNLDANGPLRELKNDKPLLPPSRWEKGKVYADEQTFTMPDWGDAMGPELTVKTGVWKNDARLRIQSGPSDGQQGGVVAKVKTGRTPKPKAELLPEMTVNKLPAGEKIVIDGKADEKAWQLAASSGAFVNVSTGNPEPSSAVQGSVKLTWDDQNLYVFFDVKDANVIGGYTDPKSLPNKFTATGQPKLWENDTVEIMTDPDGDGDNIDYYELQINPQNKVFHSQFDTYNGPKGGENGPFGHEDWDPKLKSAVVVRGTMDKPDDKDDGYTVEAAIPWSAFSKAKRTPPANGDTWRMNFYSMENNGGLSWSPILGQGNFHKATRFGKVHWAGGAPAPAPTATATASASASAAPTGKPSATATATATAKPAPSAAPTVKKGAVKLPN